jgi:GAF domain-containing protein
MQFILDLFFSLTFILLLVILAKIKERTFADNRDSYRYAVSGLVILAIVSVFQMGIHQNLLDNVPFFSEPIFQELIQAIGIIAGITLLLAGISIWLPTRSKGDKKNTATSGHAVSTSKLELFIEEAESPGRLYRQLPEMIGRTFNFDQVIIIKKSYRTGQFANCGQYNNFESNQATGGRERIMIPCGTPDEIISAVHPDFHLKYRVKGDIDGAILCWGRTNGGLDLSERSALEKIVAAFSRRLTLEYEKYKASFYEDGFRLLYIARDLVKTNSDLKSSLRWIYELFHKATGAEYLSLVMVDKFPKNFRRYTVGINGNVLFDGTNNPPFQNDYVDLVLENGQSLILPDIGTTSNLKIDSLFISCGQKALMIVPIVSFGRTRGAIILGSPRPGRFRRHEMMSAEILLTGLLPLINNEMTRHLIQERDQYMAAIAGFEASLQNLPDIETMFEQAAESILKAVGTTMVRISTIDSDRKKIITKALKTIRPFEAIKDEAVALAPELAGWHYMVASENRPFLINQNDGQSIMDNIEAEALVFGGMQSALIVPIVINGLTYGLMTLGEMRRWDRFRYDSAAISFCKTMAMVIGNAIKSIQLSRVLLLPERGENKEGWTVSTKTDIRNRLREPVTNLSGSIDLLKIKGSGLPDSERILSMMEKSADRLVSILNEE